MWFNGKKRSKKRKAEAGWNARRKPILWVSARRDRNRHGDVRKVAGFVFILALISAVIIGGWISLRLLCAWLIFDNDRFNIVNLNVEVADNAVITAELVREYTRTEEGMNLFDVDIDKIRKEFMTLAPNVKSMEISRVIPDTLRIKIIERTAIARAGRRGELGVDSDGFIFGVKSGLNTLPVITGHSGGDRSLRPGDRLYGWEYAAVQVLNICDDPRIGIYIQSIDVSNKDYLVLYLAGDKMDKLAWNGMGEVTSQSKRHLQKRLSHLARVLQSDEGKAKSRFDSTFEDKVYAEN